MRTSSAAIVIGLALCGISAAAEKDEPLPTFEETCFHVRPSGGFVSLAEAQKTLEGVGGESRIFPGDRARARLTGLFRVRDWKAEDALLVALAEPGKQLRIHAWGEGHGVCLFLSRAGAAYRIMQQPGEAMVKRLKKDPRSILVSLAATDDRRGLRLPHGAYQVRWQDGAVVVTKGNVRLMTVPLEGALKDLYIEVPNDAMLQDLALLPSGPVPEETAPARRVVLNGTRPAELPWSAKLPNGASLRKLDDGCVELAAENSTETALVTLPVAGPGLYEVIVQVDNATPGTGLALLDAKGEPLDGIEFGRDGKNLAFGFGSPHESPAFSSDFISRAVPLAGPRQWLRLVLVGGTSKCWISGDGVHWGCALDGRDRNSSWRTIALYARETSSDRKNPDSASRHFRLRSLQVREFGGLTAAVSADLRAKAAAADVTMKTAQNETPQAWAQRVARLAPQGCSPAEWRFACTLQALAAPVQSDAAEWLLYFAVRERLEDLHTLQAKIDLLQDMSLVWHYRQDWARRQVELWERLGREVLDTRADFEHYQQALMQTSIADPLERSGPISWELARDALTLFYVQHREASLVRMERLLTFWRAYDPQQIGYWPVNTQIELLLSSLDVRPAGKARRKKRIAAIDTTRAVTPPLNRAATNILSELLAALEGKQYDDAARSLIASVPPRNEGLVPAPNDDQLFISFRVALRLVLREHPGLAEGMDRQIGPADQLKIEQTLAQGDPAAVEALPLQYCGAAAAALPCQWLGDRALAAADLAQAASWYDEGLRSASPAEQPDLAARKRLVSAMLGSLQGQPPTRPVSLGGVKVPPEQFEGWVRDQLQTHGGYPLVGAGRRQTAPEVLSAADSLPVVGVMQPVVFQAAGFGQLDDSAGRGYKDGDPIPLEFRAVDWSWRNLVLQAGEDSLLVIERSRIAAFDLGAPGTPGRGKLRWDVPLRNGWSSGPVRPLVCGPCIYIRAATASGRAGVACLDGKTGRTLWLGDCGAGTLHSGSAASDPLWYRGRLFVLTVGPAGGQFASPLSLVELHPETGDVLFRQQILETADRQNLPDECQVSWAGNRLVVLVAGNVICADLQGRILWVRQETVLPSRIDPAFVHQHSQPAIESAGRLFIQQPGSCAIDCLTAETGQRCWQRGIIGLQRLVDLADDRLLVKTAQGLVVLNKTTGEVLWQREIPSMLSALARTPSGLLLCARQAVVEKPQLVFLWLDPATGQTRAYGLMPLEKDQPILFGPIAARGDRTWCCFGYGPKNDSPTAENHKQIVELRPAKPAAADEGL